MGHFITNFRVDRGVVRVSQFVGYKYFIALSLSLESDIFLDHWLLTKVADCLSIAGPASSALKTSSAISDNNESLLSFARVEHMVFPWGRLRLCRYKRLRFPCPPSEALITSVEQVLLVLLSGSSSLGSERRSFSD